MKLLVIEDNPDIVANLFAYLEPMGYALDVARNGLGGLAQAAAGSYDAIVLDLTLPGLDGLDVARRLRKDFRRPTPILMLTARDTIADKVTGFESGADDYLVKPFAPEELAARLRAVSRRHVGASSSQRRYGDVVLDLAAKRAARDGHAVELTAREWAVLEALAQRGGRLYPKRELELQVLGDDAEVLSNALEVHVSSLRRKLGRELIETVRGLGYRLGPEAA